MVSVIPAWSQDYVDDQTIPEEAVIFMERTQCYGTCPVYKFYILEDGTARYYGKANVTRTGSYEAALPPERIEALISTFYTFDFFEFEDRYVDLISDLPTTYLYLSHNGKTKKITDYHRAPKKLKMLEKEVDKFIEKLDWSKIEE